MAGSSVGAAALLLLTLTTGSLWVAYGGTLWRPETWGDLLHHWWVVQQTRWTTRAIRRRCPTARPARPAQHRVDKTTPVEHRIAVILPRVTAAQGHRAAAQVRCAAANLSPRLAARGQVRAGIPPTSALTSKLPAGLPPPPSGKGVAAPSPQAVTPADSLHAA